MNLISYFQNGFNLKDSAFTTEFKYRTLNAIIIVAVIFSALFAIFSDLGINDRGPIHTKVNYAYSVLSFVLLLLLRRKGTFSIPVCTSFLLLSFLTFVSSLIFVVHDEYRIVWFYFVIFVTYILLGSPAGVAMTLLALSTIITCAIFVDLNITVGALITALAGLLIGSLLSRIYTVQMRRYEQLLETKNQALANTVSDLDEALEQAQLASRTKSLFLANMSHEIRTPLNGVLGMIQVMHSTRLDDQQHHYLETIERSGKSLLMLIDDLLDITKIEAGKLKLDLAPFDTFNWVIDVQVISEPLFEDSNVAFISEVSDELPPCLLGDAQRLLQVAVNLLSNSAKFTHEGEVRLDIGGHKLDSGHYCLQVSVMDTGIGIPKAKLEHIFDSFQQVAPERITNKGVGLGLAISKRLVENMDGSLTAYSSDGEGSRFVMEVELPIVTEEAPKKEAPRNISDKRFKVLLVDDDPINRLAVGTLLQQQGNTVVEAQDGKEALSSIHEHLFDVVLMDVHMPQMDGVEATRQIRASNLPHIASTAIIGLTASVMSDEKQSYLEAGMDAVVEKPVVGDNLFRVIAQCTHDKE